MSLVRAFVTENGNPLRRAYVEHMAFGFGVEMKITDENGSFTFEAGPAANQIDVRIHAQNTVVRVVHGDQFNRALSIDKRVANGDQINIVSTVDFCDHFRILNIMQDVYDTVWRDYRPYSTNAKGDYPAGKKDSVRATFSSNTRIELSFPDRFNPDPHSKNWVEPAGATNNMMPLMHIRDENPALFSSPDNAWAVLAHETGHAMHFSALPSAKRVEIEARYLTYILRHLDNSGHRLDIATDPFIAYIEAIGAFSSRFFFFAKFIEPSLTDADLRKAFTRDELTGHRSSRFPPVTTAQGATFAPVITGNNKEGAVYGAIFLDFGKRIGLRAAVNYVLESGAITFAEYKSFVIATNDADHTAAINAVSATWRL